MRQPDSGSIRASKSSIHKSGARKNDAMKAVLSAATDSEISDMALFYALQKPARAATPAAGDQAAGKAATTACTACHGNSGVGTDPATPNLAGQDAQYLAAALHAYKDGLNSRRRRRCTGR